MDIKMIFPLHIRKKLPRAFPKQGLEEIRIRIGQPMELTYDKGSCCLIGGQGEEPFLEAWGRSGQNRFGQSWEEADIYRITEADIAEMLNYISDYSLYAYREELKQGFLTIEGGHRIGVAGGAVTEAGKITGMHHITFFNIRIAHEKIGCAGELVRRISGQGSIYNTLLFSAPGVGKTTYLRDAIRILSEGTKERTGLRVSVVDERSEIAACYRGIPQNDLGPRTDVLDGCGKAEGMQLLLRSMSPQVIAVDELGCEEDFRAAEQAAYCGSRVLGTLHAGDPKELMEKPLIKAWRERNVFGRYVWIRREIDGSRRFQVYDGRMEQLC